MKYKIIIFDVDDKGCMQKELCKVVKCSNLKQAINNGKNMQKQRNVNEPLPISDIWGNIGYLLHIWDENTDKLLFEG